MSITKLKSLDTNENKCSVFLQENVDLSSAVKFIQSLHPWYRVTIKRLKH